MTNQVNSDDGFTLIELLVVIAIIGILAVAAVPQVMDAICQSRVSTAQGDISTVQTAMSQCDINQPDAGDGNCDTLDADYQDLLPERIWDNAGDQSWALQDSGNCIEVTNLDAGGCDVGDLSNVDGDLSFDIEKGEFFASAGC